MECRCQIPCRHRPAVRRSNAAVARSLGCQGWRAAARPFRVSGRHRSRRCLFQPGRNADRLPCGLPDCAGVGLRHRYAPQRGTLARFADRETSPRFDRPIPCLPLHRRRSLDGRDHYLESGRESGNAADSGFFGPESGSRCLRRFGPTVGHGHAQWRDCRFRNAHRQTVVQLGRHSSFWRVAAAMGIQRRAPCFLGHHGILNPMLGSRRAAANGVGDRLDVPPVRAQPRRATNRSV